MRPDCRRTASRFRFVLLTALLLSLPAMGRDPVAPVLRIYNWEYFLDPELAAEFGRRTGATVRQSYFDSDWERDYRLTAGGREEFDVVMVDAAQVGEYRARGWIVPIGVERVPGLARAGQRWRDAAAGTATHAVPFAWGTLGIAYRADLVKRPLHSWLDLLRPDAALCGKALLGDDARELVAVALKATGHSANSVDHRDYEQASELLAAQRRCIIGFHYPGVTSASDLVTGKAWAALAYDNDTAWLQALNPDIRFVLPREGGLIWIDYWVVMSSSPHKSLAYAFLEFLSEPAVMTRVTAYNHAASPHARGGGGPPTTRPDRAIAPSSPELDASELIRNPPPNIMSLRNQIFARLIRPN